MGTFLLQVRFGGRKVGVGAFLLLPSQRKRPENHDIPVECGFRDRGLNETKRIWPLLVYRDYMRWKCWVPSTWSGHGGFLRLP